MAKAGKLASKAKTPLAAGVAGAAGLAGGALLGARRASSDGGSAARALGAAAKEFGRAGFSLGQLASEVRQVREKMK